jgi:ABC-2 type transport system permease protein
MLAFPVETLTGTFDRARALQELGIQWVFVIVVIVLARNVWAAGIRRYEAYGS